MVISIKINNPRVFFGGKLIYKLKVSIKNSEMYYISELFLQSELKQVELAYLSSHIQTLLSALEFHQFMPIRLVGCNHR